MIYTHSILHSLSSTPTKYRLNPANQRRCWTGGVSNKVAVIGHVQVVRPLVAKESLAPQVQTCDILLHCLKTVVCVHTDETSSSCSLLAQLGSVTLGALHERNANPSRLIRFFFFFLNGDDNVPEEGSELLPGRVQGPQHE